MHNFWVFHKWNSMLVCHTRMRPLNWPVARIIEIALRSPAWPIIQPERRKTMTPNTLMRHDVKTPSRVPNRIGSDMKNWVFHQGSSFWNSCMQCATFNISEHTPALFGIHAALNSWISPQDRAGVPSSQVPSSVIYHSQSNGLGCRRKTQELRTKFTCSPANSSLGPAGWWPPMPYCSFDLSLGLSEIESGPSPNLDQSRLLGGGCCSDLFIESGIFKKCESIWKL